MKLIASLAVATTLLTASSARAADSIPPHPIRFTVIDRETEKPMPQAHLFYRFWASEFRTPGEVDVNKEGVVTLHHPFSESDIRTGITFKADGYQDYHVNFHLLPTTKDLPSEKTIRMIHGQTLSGSLADENGEPLANVEVIARRVGDEHVPGFRYKLKLCKTTSDAEGKFALRWLDPGTKHDLEFTRKGIITKTIQPDFDQPMQVTLSRTKSIRGVVNDFRGKPLSGASVTVQQQQGYYSRAQKQASADKDGRFEIGEIGSFPVDVVVVAKRMTPATMQIANQQEADDVNFRLLPGRIIRFEIVDETNNPLPGVRITTTRWQNMPLSGIEGVTDTEGRLTLRGLPSDDVAYSFAGDGIERTGGSFVAGSDSHRVVCKKSVRINLRVMDTEDETPLIDP